MSKITIDATKPNAEELVIAWLNTILPAGYQASGSKPSNKTKYVLVDRTGGPRESMVLDMAEILVEVYTKDSLPECSRLAQAIADRVIELRDFESVTRAVVNSVVRLDDTITQTYRYQIYIDLYNRR